MQRRAAGARRPDGRRIIRPCGSSGRPACPTGVRPRRTCGGSTRALARGHRPRRPLHARAAARLLRRPLQGDLHAADLDRRRHDAVRPVPRPVSRPPADARAGAGTVGAGRPCRRCAAAGCRGRRRRTSIDLSRHFLDGQIPTRRLASHERRGGHRRPRPRQGDRPLDGRDVPDLHAEPPGRVPGRTTSACATACGTCSGCPTARRRRRPTALAEPWRPYRSIATWYLWRRGSATPSPGHRGLARRRVAARPPGYGATGATPAASATIVNRIMALDSAKPPI